MAFPPLHHPAWLRQHLLHATHPNQVPEALLSQVRQGLSRYASVAPRVSIVIPAFNEEANIFRTLSSIAALRLPDLLSVELLVVDDASTDATPDWLHALGVPTLRMTQNGSVKEARHRGLQSCRGEIVLQADADSVYPPDWGIQYVEILAHQGVSLVYGGHAFLPDPRTSRLAFACHEALGNLARSLRRRHREHINVHGFNSAFWRDQAIQYGSYDHDEKGSEDGHMALQLALVGRLHYCSAASCLVWTSPRRLLAHGSLWQGSWRRIQRDGLRLVEYLTGKKGNSTKP